MRLLDVWEVTTENLLAFAPDSVVNVFRRAQDLAADNALWPPDHRQRAKAAATSGESLGIWYPEGFAKAAIAHQKEMRDARMKLEDLNPDDA